MVSTVITVRWMCWATSHAYCNKPMYKMIREYLVVVGVAVEKLPPPTKVIVMRKYTKQWRSETKQQVIRKNIEKK